MSNQKKVDFLDPLTWPVIDYQRSANHLDYSPISGIYVIAGWTLEEFYGRHEPKIYYIGESNDIARRLNCHPREKDLPQIMTFVRYYYETEYRKLGEKILIKIFRPLLNIQHNGHE